MVKSIPMNFTSEGEMATGRGSASFDSQVRKVFGLYSDFCVSLCNWNGVHLFIYLIGLGIWSLPGSHVVNFYQQF